MSPPGRPPAPFADSANSDLSSGPPSSRGPVPPLEDDLAAQQLPEAGEAARTPHRLSSKASGPLWLLEAAPLRCTVPARLTLLVAQQGCPLARPALTAGLVGVCAGAILDDMSRAFQVARGFRAPSEGAAPAAEPGPVPPHHSHNLFDLSVAPDPLSIMSPAPGRPPPHARAPALSAGARAGEGAAGPSTGEAWHRRQQTAAKGQGRAGSRPWPWRQRNSGPDLASVSKPDGGECRGPHATPACPCAW